MKLLNDVLEAYGYDIIKTASGAAVLELARQHGPDLILIDIQLPDISGLEAVRQLKGHAQTKAIPVIAVTAFAMAGDERRALDAGCDGYIAKPIMLREFLLTVEDSLAGGRQKADKRPAETAAGRGRSCKSRGRTQSGNAPDAPKPETGPRSVRFQVV